jgi:uncharacterized membrane protein YkoI
MSTKAFRIGFLIVVGAGLSAAFAFSQPPAQRDEETTIKLVDAPEAVRTAAAKLAPEKNITKVTRESDDGITTYEVEFTQDGVAGSGTFTPMGDVLEVEREVAESKLPAAAVAAVKKANPGSTIGSVALVTRTYYELQIVKDGQKREVKVDASGEIDRDEGDEGHEKRGK